MPERLRCLLISDFNVETFKSQIGNDSEAPAVEALAAPYGRVVPVLKGMAAAADGPLPDCSVIWTQPERIVPSFRSVLDHRPVSPGAVLEEVDAYCRLIDGIREHVRTVFIPTWVLPAHSGGYGMLSMANSTGPANLLMRMNLRLCENFKNAPNVHVLDAQRWTGPAGRNAFSPKLWYLCKVPFGNEVFEAAAADIKAALRGVSGGARKLIVLDLDNTLWGGIVGEVGWKGLNLGGHNALGEAYADFQGALKALTRRGVILGIASKNTEAAALEVFRNHPEMVLTLDDFAGWRINWRDKARNIADLVSELGLGLQSTVFIDDTPAERVRVRHALPDVAVPEWPRNAMFYKTALLALPWFDAPALSREDVARSRMYAAERKRKTLRGDLESADDWLRTLNTRIRIEDLGDANLQRVVQLLNKTNQMNLSTRRVTEAELLDWLGISARRLWTFRVADTFGDMGLCGVLSLERDGSAARIVDFVLSCRVIGRKVEEAMLHTAITHARSQGFEAVYADYLPTPGNEPCRLFFEGSGMHYDRQADRFTWNLKRDYGMPRGVTLERPMRSPAPVPAAGP